MALVVLVFGKPESDGKAYEDEDKGPHDGLKNEEERDVFQWEIEGQG
jgi:hypothetical protein